ncbi:acyltransferase [Pantoea agglomerans]|uniref:acyltransferase family protein n=1 Tax=Enterobacter agglomerans TaxID=549 RepID=UPI00177BCDC3|nr:acyltransferase [Pantoea agglomerans]MBD8242475.1 acyltransferase [Pantoea agglomerans]
MPENTNKLESIQALRGLAAMLVVMFHFRTDLASDFPLANRLFGNGAIGVDLFFMISGFIAYYITKNENFGIASSKKFLIKRVCRVVPPYVIATLFIAGNSWDKWSFTLRSFLFLPADITQAAPYFGYPRLFIGWSLNYEIVFYGICAFALLFRKAKFIWLTILITSLVFLPYFSHGYSNAISSTNYGYHGYLALLTNGMMLEFLAGLLIAHLAIGKKITFSRKIGRLAIISSAAYFVYVTLGYGTDLGNGHYSFACACFFLLMSVTTYEFHFGIKPPGFLISIGTISFSVYLMHPHGLSLARKIIYRHYQGHFAGLTTTIVALIITVSFSVIFYRYVEVWLCNTLRKKILAPNKMLTAH